jgi:hypothetical protein
MSGYVLHIGASVECNHHGSAAPLIGSLRVRVDGKAAIIQIIPYLVSGCPHTVGGSAVPCVIGTWTQCAKRVKSLGQPLVLTDSESTSIPNGTPLNPTKTQKRVRAT